MRTRPEAQVRNSKNTSLLEKSHFCSRTLQQENQRQTAGQRASHLSVSCGLLCETSVQDSVSPLLKTVIIFKKEAGL